MSSVFAFLFLHFAIFAMLNKVNILFECCSVLFIYSFQQ